MINLNQNKLKPIHILILLLLVLILILILACVLKSNPECPKYNKMTETEYNKELEKEIDISDLNKYQNDKYGYEINYPKNAVEIILNEIFERGTEGNPSFRIKNGGHFAIGVWDNPKNLTARQWIDKQYLEYSGGWFGEFEEIIIGEEKAYSALTTEPCYIEWIIIPKSDRFYTFGVELCDENIEDSLNIFKDIAGSFKFVP